MFLGQTLTYDCFNLVTLSPFNVPTWLPKYGIHGGGSYSHYAPSLADNQDLPAPVFPIIRIRPTLLSSSSNN